MADPPRRRRPRETDGDRPARPDVVRRAPGERRPIPPEAAAVDRGEPVWRARRPAGPRAPELRDPRAEAMVAGVANRAARKVYDETVARLRELRDTPESDTLGDALLDASRLALWEVRRVVGFAAFVEDVIGISAPEASKLVAAAEARAGCTRAAIPPYARAIVLRARAALSEARTSGAIRSSADVYVTGDGQTLRVSLDAAGADAAAALSAVGRVLWPLAEDLAQRGSGPPPGRDRRR